MSDRHPRGLACTTSLVAVVMLLGGCSNSDDRAAREAAMADADRAVRTETDWVSYRRSEYDAPDCQAPSGCAQSSTLHLWTTTDSLNGACAQLEQLRVGLGSDGQTLERTVDEDGMDQGVCLGSVFIDDVWVVVGAMAPENAEPWAPPSVGRTVVRFEAYEDAG